MCLQQATVRSIPALAFINHHNHFPPINARASFDKFFEKLLIDGGFVLVEMLEDIFGEF